MKQKRVNVDAAPPAKKAKGYRLSLQEFRAWLSGVEEMQSEDWIPDATQWKKIRAKIDDIVEGRSFNSGGAGPSQEYEQPAAPRVIRPAGPSLLDNVPVATPVAPPSFMNTSGVAGAKLSTPSIDTSSGRYSSSLE